MNRQSGISSLAQFFMAAAAHVQSPLGWILTLLLRPWMLTPHPTKRLQKRPIFHHGGASSRRGGGATTANAQLHEGGKHVPVHTRKQQLLRCLPCCCYASVARPLLAAAVACNTAMPPPPPHQDEKCAWAPFHSPLKFSRDTM